MTRTIIPHRGYRKFTQHARCATGTMHRQYDHELFDNRKRLMHDYLADINVGTAPYATQAEYNLLMVTSARVIMTRYGRATGRAMLIRMNQADSPR